MKKIIIAALSLCSISAFAGNSGPAALTQLGTLEGCSANANQSALIVMNSTSGTAPWYIVSSQNASFGNLSNILTQAFLASKPGYINNNTTTTFQYKATNGQCYTQSFIQIDGFQMTK